MEGDDSDIGSESINKLVAAMDDFIPIPERPVDQPFFIAYRRRFFDFRPRYSSYRPSRKRKSDCW